MQGLTEEILIAPQPLVCLLGEAEQLENLVQGLRAAGQRSQLRYEAHPFKHSFAPLLRSHSREEYASYMPPGILPSNWLSKHQNSVPAVLVRCALNSPAPWPCRLSSPPRTSPLSLPSELRCPSSPLPCARLRRSGLAWSTAWWPRSWR